MAYNPFDFFRANQKILFSIITVIIMFVFVLSIGGGRGDFFNWFPDMLRSSRSTGEVMAVIDGSDIKESKLSDLRRNRGYANQYMVLAQTRAAENLDRYTRENMKKASPELVSRMTRYYQAENTVRSQMPQLQQFLQGSQGNNPELIQFVRQRTMQLIGDMNNAFQQVLAMGSQPDLKQDDKDMIEALKKLDQIRRNGGAERQYFTEMPNKTGRDSIEFLLWMKKADDLGVRFRNDDIDAMVSQELLQFTAADREKVLNEMFTEQRQKPLSREKLYEALANEFRVRTAMTTVLGPDTTRGVESMNPFDLYEFFRKETSAGRYGVIAFPVDNFLDQVQGEPSDQDLKKLFDQTRTTEPNPNEAKPGIKEPRRLKIQFLEATGKEPFYTAAGADALMKGELNAKLAGLLTVPFGTGGAGLFAAPSILTLSEPSLQSSYKRYQDAEKDKLMRRWFPGNFSVPYPTPVDAHLINVTTLFSSVGMGATPTAILSVPYSFFGTAELLERKARLTYGFPLLAPPLLDGLAGLTDVTAAWAVQGLGIPEPLSLAAVKPVLVKDLNERTRFEVAQTDLQSFYTELMKVSAPKEKAQSDEEAKAAQEYIAKFTGTQPWKDKDGKDQMGRGLKLAGSTEFQDQFNMVNDPGLAPLVKLWKPTNVKEYKDPASFAQPFFANAADPRTGKPLGGGLYRPILDPQAFGEVPTPQDQRPVFIAWRTADQPAEAPRVMDDKAKPKLVAIWKRQKAKELAKEAADDLVKKFDGKLGSNVVEISQKLTSARTEFANSKFAAPQLREKVAQFEIPDTEDRAARGVGARMITSQMNPQTGESGFSLQAFQLSPSTQIPHPNQKMYDELITNRNKPLSTAFTVMDNPESTVYVAVLEDRTEEGLLRFNNLVYNPDPKTPNQVARAILEQYLLNARQNARQLAVEMLKAEYGYVKENPELDKKFSDSSN